MRVVLDTDILSAIIKKKPKALSNARNYLKTYGRFTISIITRYEILRGLKAKNATRQITNFNLLCSKMSILPLNDEIIVKAADLYADLLKRGKVIGDADILIAATAIIHDCKISTNNTNHFERIPALELENWLKQ